MKNFASCGSCLNRYSSREKLDNQKKHTAFCRYVFVFRFSFFQQSV
ncbi:hypothetical protein B425_0509 [Bacillus amyloliquefaciens]|nr:hypothetical protein B425_0509 [Bacillus amyloliquefaciens]